MTTALILEDDLLVRKTFARLLAAHGVDVLEAGDVDTALRLKRESRPDLCVVDLGLSTGVSGDEPPARAGLDFVARVRIDDTATPIVVLSGSSDENDIRDAYTAGAQLYVRKGSLEQGRIADVLRACCPVVHTRADSADEGTDEEDALLPEVLDRLLGVSPAVAMQRRLIARIAPTDLSVLITGESGTGKELVAQVLHESSTRAAEPLIVVDCTSMPDTLVDSLLFGHERGSFTGASERRSGSLELAGAGTLFLDEIGELPLAQQAKLLRVLESRRFRRLGGREDIDFRARVIAATNRPLDALVDQGRFRLDLYHRLAYVHLRLPPLAARPEDIPILARAFAAARGKRLTEDAVARLEGRAWPGNVRQLRNAVMTAAALADASGRAIDVLHLDRQQQLGPQSTCASVPPSSPVDAAALLLEELACCPPGTDKVATATDRLRALALEQVGGNQCEAAELLGESRHTIHRWCRKRNVP